MSAIGQAAAARVVPARRSARRRAWIWPLWPAALCAALALLALPGPARGALPPALLATFSLLAPGSGQMINKDFVEGGIQAGMAITLFTNYSRLMDDDRFLDSDERLDDEQKVIHMNRVTFEADLYGTALVSLSLYSSFSAYRDARQLRNNAGYDTPAPTETLGELAAAPFNFDYLLRPTTWVPLIFPLIFALSSPNDDDRYVFKPDNTISRDELTVGFAGVHEMVAVGEESFFRGVLNNGFSSGLGEPWGLVVSSTVFGLAHDGRGGSATPLAAGIFGAYVGFLQQRNEYRIGQGVAIHFWWNFLVTLGMLKDRAPKQTVELFSFSYKY